MPYDANDPDTKAAVQAAIDAALEEAQTAHEAEIEGLKTKNADLVKRISKLRSGNGDGSHNEEISRLEKELDESNSKLGMVEGELRETKRQLKKVEGERDTFKTQAETEGNFSRNMLVESGLTSALVEANVAPQFMEAAKAMLGKAVSVKVDGDNRTAVVGDKSLGDYVKEWSASDAGKHFVKAPASGGGGATGAGTQGGAGKKFSEMTEAERIDMARTNPAAWEQLLKENNINIAA